MINRSLADQDPEKKDEVVIEWKHIERSLTTTRSSISSQERRRLAAIYKEFVDWSKRRHAERRRQQRDRWKEQPNVNHLVCPELLPSQLSTCLSETMACSENPQSASSNAPCTDRLLPKSRMPIHLWYYKTAFPLAKEPQAAPTGR